MKTLRQYQREDVDQLKGHLTHGVFNEQRTGKTPTTLVAMCEDLVGRVVIICTASMQYVWRAEALAWTTHTPYIYAGDKREDIFSAYARDNKGILIMSYDLFRSTRTSNGMIDRVKSSKPVGLIVDECHRAVGRKTANFKSLDRLRHIPKRYYLTGTPAPNHPSQVWSLLRLMDPIKFSSFWRFAEEFFDMDEQRLPSHVAAKTGIDCVREPAGFIPGKQDDYTQLLSEHSIMRKRVDVMPWLPKQEAPTRVTLPTTFSQRKYLSALAEFYEVEDVIVQGVLDQMLRYRQICLAPALLGLAGSSPKIDWLADYLNDYPDKSIVIFSRFTQFIHLIKKKLGGCCEIVVGATKADDRYQLIKSFQAGELKCLVIQIDAGKEGITLDQADTLIFTDTFPPASDILQARDRIVATSEGVSKPKEIIELAMEGTYDEELYNVVDRRIAITDVANNYIRYLKGV